MKLLKMLQSPLALVVQGFVAGGFLFFAVQPLSGGDASPPRATGSVLSTLQV